MIFPPSRPSKGVVLRWEAIAEVNEQDRLREQLVQPPAPKVIPKTQLDGIAEACVLGQSSSTSSSSSCSSLASSLMVELFAGAVKDAGIGA